MPLVAPVVLVTLSGLSRGTGDVDFERQIRPIFAASCVECHGPDKQKGGLRFDSAAGARDAIVAGHPDKSSLIERVTASEADERMPQKADALSAAQIDTLREWILAGAQWPESGTETSTRSSHWSYQPVVRPAVPKVADERGLLSPIDWFVQAKLEAAGLVAAPEADIPTLMRRVALDLTGLPAIQEHVTAVLSGQSTETYEQYVDALLASPAYAERRAQTWLDLARYADTNGYEKDERRTAWRWRDWVLDAYARNMPFDEFTVKQLAGDLLPDATLDDRIATGFHRNTLTNQEGGTDSEEFRVAAVVDRVNTTAGVWLGTTLACAQCHAHKFDPFTHQDYYRFFAFFDSTEDVGHSLDPQIPAATREQAARTAELEARIAQLEAAILAPADTDQMEPGWRKAQRESLAQDPGWTPFAPVHAKARNGSALTELDDHSYLASGEQPATEVYELEGDLVRGAPMVRIEVLADPSLPDDGPGRAGHGNFVLSDVVVEQFRDDGWRRMPAVAAEATHEQMRGGTFRATHAIDADPKSGWAIWRESNTCDPEVLVLALEAELRPTRTRVRLHCESDYAQHALGRFRVSLGGDEARARLVGIGADVRAALLADAPTPEQAALVHRRFKSEVGPGREHARTLVERRAELDALAKRVPTALVMKERAEKRVTRVLEKGSFLAPGEVVEPGTPVVLPPMPAGAPRDRLGLARWIVAIDNPLTARVQVNRVWGELFGTPLVATVDDFGTRGERPTHPELLDWLAAEFVASGWDVRALYRTIVTSATYRRASNADAALLAKDRANVWLARQSRPRLEVETLRDQALAIAGLLDGRFGGPSVMPPQPDGVWAPVYSGDSWATAQGNDRFRRGLYTFWRRGAHYLTYALFDAPSRELACTRRARSNSPLQALALLDDPAFVECAAGLAQRMLLEGGTADHQRLAHGIGWATQRPCEPFEEMKTLGILLAKERARYAADPEAARALVAHVAPALRDGSTIDPVELAAWTSVAQVLLNLDEVVTRN